MLGWLAQNTLLLVSLASGFGALSVVFGLMAGIAGHIEAVEANAAASEANEKAAKAQLALARLKSPRTIGQDRRGAFADKLRFFAGRQYIASISSAADDGPAFWRSLHDALRDAGWSYIPPARNAISFGDPPANTGPLAIPGIDIRCDCDPKDEAVKAAQALRDALMDEGIVASVTEVPTRGVNPSTHFR